MVMKSSSNLCVRLLMLLVNERAAEVYRTVGVSLDVFLSCRVLWFALLSHGVTGTVGQQQQRRACYRASMLCFHSYATAGWGGAELTHRSLGAPWFTHPCVRREQEVKQLVSFSVKVCRMKEHTSDWPQAAYQSLAKVTFISIKSKLGYNAEICPHDQKTEESLLRLAAAKNSHFASRSSLFLQPVPHPNCVRKWRLSATLVSVSPVLLKQADCAGSFENCSLGH